MSSRSFEGRPQAADVAVWLSTLSQPVYCAYGPGCTSFALARRLRGHGHDCDAATATTATRPRPRLRRGHGHDCDAGAASVLVIFFEFPMISAFCSLPVAKNSNFRRFVATELHLKGVGKLKCEVRAVSFSPPLEQERGNRRQFEKNGLTSVEIGEIVGYSSFWQGFRRELAAQPMRQDSET